MALLNNGRPAELVQYTLATLPMSTDYVGSLIFVTDASSGVGAVCVGVAAGSPLGESVSWIDLVTNIAVA